MSRRDRRGNPDRAERLALCARQERSAAVDRGGARHRERAAAGLSQPGRRPGRTGVRRRVVRAECRSARWRRSLPAFEENITTLRWTKERRRLALQRTGRAAARRRQGRLRRLRAGPARLCRQERISRRAARRLRRHRFGAVRGDRGRCARRRARARRDAAVSLHRAGVARRRGQARQRARHPLRGAADRAGRERLRGDSVRHVRRACRATSPKRICRRAPAARC